ncbi:MAG: DUF6152 family protein [Bryobacteraceae bacterium]
MKLMNRTARRIMVVAGLLTGVASLALAHHSYSAFDMVELVTVTGTVKKLDWTNPHTWIWLDVVNEKGVAETWGIEGMSPNYLARRGWSRTTLKPGEKISITLHPLKSGEKGGTWVDAKRPNGETLMMGGPITEP